MTAIWHNGGSGWDLLAPAGFPSEAALHNLVEEAPHLLPLAGSPRLSVVGREVLLGGNYADLIAVEPSGRLVVVEIKLKKSAEARRAVVAQILTYAAYLRGMDPARLEGEVLAQHLKTRYYERLADAVSGDDQTGSFDAVAFGEGLSQSLAAGHFRLVLVLDEAPTELVRLVGYLEAVTEGLLIDLITVASYDVSGSTVIVPQRVDPERPVGNPIKASASTTTKTTGRYVEGAKDFADAIPLAPPASHDALRRLTDWAALLEKEGLVKLGTYHGTTGRWTLLPRLRATDSGLVTIWNDGSAYLQLWRSVFEKRAPEHLLLVEEFIKPLPVGQGTVVKALDDALLALLTEAYREAAGKVS